MFSNKIPACFVKNTSILTQKRSFKWTKCEPYIMPKCIPRPEEVKVTVLGARSDMGQAVSLLLKQCSLIKELRLYSTAEETCGIALDLAQIDTNAVVKAYVGQHLLRDALEDAHVIVLCSELPDKIETEDCLLERIGYAVKNFAIYASEFNPNGIFCIGCPPINSLVPLVSEEYKRAGVYDPRKIIGISTVANCMANSIVACGACLNPCEVRVPVIGGLCEETLVPVISQTQPCLKIPPKCGKMLYSAVRKSGETILKSKFEEGSGGCALLTGFGVCRFVSSLVKAIHGSQCMYECAYVRQIGHIGEFLPYMSSLVKLGKCGIENTYMPKLNPQECCLLQDSANKIRNSIQAGRSFVTGELPKQPKRVPYTPPICKAPNLDCHLLHIDLPERRPDTCGLVEAKQTTDANVMRDTQTAIRMKLEEEYKKKGPTAPEKEKREFCQKKLKKKETCC